MKNVIQVALAVLVMIACTGMLQAQEMKVKKYDNPEWVRVAYVKFKPMMKDRAQAIIKDYFMKADMNLGNPGPMAFDMASGEYDMLVIFQLEEGLETLNYEMSPDDVKWMQEMSKLTGGPDKAMAKLQEFYSYVDRWDSELARKH